MYAYDLVIIGSRTGAQVVGGPALTPASGHDGSVVARNILDGNQYRPDYRGIPTVASTVPPIAAVGFSEAEARARGLKFRVHSEKVPHWYTAMRGNESVYGFKTLIEAGTDRYNRPWLKLAPGDVAVPTFEVARAKPQSTQSEMDRPESVQRRRDIDRSGTPQSTRCPRKVFNWHASRNDEKSDRSRHGTPSGECPRSPMADISCRSTARGNSLT